MKKCDICLDAPDCTLSPDTCGFTCLDCAYADSHTEIYGCELCPLDEE